MDKKRAPTVLLNGWPSHLTGQTVSLNGQIWPVQIGLQIVGPTRDALSLSSLLPHSLPPPIHSEHHCRQLWAPTLTYGVPPSSPLPSFRLPSAAVAMVIVWRRPSPHRWSRGAAIADSSTKWHRRQRLPIHMPPRLEQPPPPPPPPPDSAGMAWILGRGEGCMTSTPAWIWLVADQGRHRQLPLPAVVARFGRRAASTASASPSRDLGYSCRRRRHLPPSPSAAAAVVASRRPYKGWENIRRGREEETLKEERGRRRGSKG